MTTKFARKYILVNLSTALGYFYCVGYVVKIIERKGMVDIEPCVFECYV